MIRVQFLENYSYLNSDGKTIDCKPGDRATLSDTLGMSLVANGKAKILIKSIKAAPENK